MEKEKESRDSYSLSFDGFGELGSLIICLYFVIGNVCFMANCDNSTSKAFL